MDKDRLTYIDITKGIGIIFVVWFYMPSINKLPNFTLWGGYITTFYMPLFFIMSGLFFKPTNLLVKVRRLMIPYCFFYVLAFGLYVLKMYFKHQTIDLFNFFVPFLGGTNNYQNTPVWFLLALTEIIVLSYIISSWFNKYQGVLLGIVLGFTGYLLGKHDFHLPYYLDVALLNMPFFLVAYYYRSVILKYVNMVNGILFLIFSVGIYLISPGFTNVSQNYIPMGAVSFYLISFTSSLGLICVLKSINGSCGTILSFFGKNSLVIMCTHIMLMSLASFCEVHIDNIYIVNIAGLCAILFIEIPICFIINKYGRVLICK